MRAETTLDAGTLAAARRELEDDGATLVRNVLGSEQVSSARAAIAACRASPGPHYGVLSAPGAPLVDSDLFRWRDVAPIGELVQRSALPSLAGALLGCDRVILVEDQWFASAPGSSTPSPWHQDAPYYRIDRPFLTLWVALDETPADLCLRVVPGSHRGPIYAPVEFTAEAVTIGAAGDLPPVPAVDDEPDRFTVRTWTVQAGDVVALDARTLHATGPGTVGPGGFQRLSTRWAHPDSRYVDVGPQVARFWDLLPHGLLFGDPLACDVFPVIDAPIPDGGALAPAAQ